jgi:hypothetical protein
MKDFLVMVGIPFLVIAPIIIGILWYFFSHPLCTTTNVLLGVCA